MEHNAGIQGLGESLVTKWTSRSIGALSLRDQQDFSVIVAAFGQLSAAAQGLKAPITDFTKLLGAGDQVLYLAAHRPSVHKVVVYGGLKVGARRLWVWPPGESSQFEVTANCVLDFYVHESVQRQGIGKLLFEAFLEDAGTTADRLAYDLPSPKCQEFLKRHYGLESPIGLTNNYVVFPSFFQALLSAQPPQTSSPWASVSSRPLTSKGSRGRLSLAASKAQPVSQGPLPLHGMPTPGASQWSGGGPIGVMGPSAPPGPLSRAGSFSQPPGNLFLWGPSVSMPPGGSSDGAIVPWEHKRAPPCQGGQASALRGCDGNAAQAQVGNLRDQPQLGSLHARSEGLPPLRQGHGMWPCIAGGSQLASPQRSYRMQIKISPTGKAQRSGAGAGQCLQW